MKILKNSLQNHDQKEKSHAKQLTKVATNSVTQHLGLGSARSQGEAKAYNPKMKITRERIDKMRQVGGFTFGIRMIVITIMAILIMVPVYAVIRYIVLLSLVAEPIFALRVVCNSVEVYSNILALDISLVEMVMWNNSVPVAGMPAKDFALLTVNNLLAIHAETLDLTKSSIGKTGVDYNKVMNQNTCQLLQEKNTGHHPYVNCNEAIADIVNQPLQRFLPLYYRMAQQLTTDWTNAKDYQERIELLREPHYASMLAYQVYNSLGLSDEIYYSLMMPTVTSLLDQLDSIEPAVNLTSIISALFLVIMLPIGANFAYFSLQRVLLDYWELVYTIPLRLIETNSRLRQKLKYFHKHKSFGSFT